MRLVAPKVKWLSATLLDLVSFSCAPRLTLVEGSTGRLVCSRRDAPNHFYVVASRVALSLQQSQDGGGA